MPLPSLEERRPTITPQLAMRVAVLGGIAFALFAIVFFRLWFLQVLSGEDSVAQSRENRATAVSLRAAANKWLTAGRVALSVVPRERSEMALSGSRTVAVS